MIVAVATSRSHRITDRLYYGPGYYRFVRRVIAILLLAASPVAADPAKRCDAAKLEEQGVQAWNEGMLARALASFEDAARCKPSDHIHELAAMASCKLHKQTKSDVYATKAKRYYEKLPEPKRQRVAQYCTGGCGGAGGPSEPRD